MIQGFNHLDFLRSLSFGGLLGAGIAGIIYLRSPYVQGITSLPVAMSYGGVAGAGTQRAIEGVINFVVSPIFRFITYYEKLIELDLHLWTKRISEEQYKSINAKLTEERFLGKGSDKQLPPGTVV